MTNIKELQAQVEALKEYQAKGEEQIRQNNKERETYWKFQEMILKN